MNEVLLQENVNIKDLIYEVRGVEVMLDSDLAKLYNTETKKINQTVKRNIGKFTKEFSFQLTNEETRNCLRSQIVTLNINNNKRGLHIKYNPYVFTEYGVIMLFSVLKSELANEVNKKVIKAFVNNRNYLLNNANIYKK